MIQAAPPLPNVSAKTDIYYAGFWRRVLAYGIDVMLLTAVNFIVTIAVLTVAPNDNRLTTAVSVGRVGAAIAWAYFAVLESSPARATVGKLALNLYVSDLHGDPITFWRASFRYWLKFLSSLIAGLGWLMTAFTPRKQALHDLFAGTLVLRKVNYLVIGQEPPTQPGDYWDGKSWVASVAAPIERS